MAEAFELILLLLVGGLALFVTKRPRLLRWSRLSRAFSRFANQRGRAVVAVGLLSGLISAGVSTWRPPVPRVHDEFSYLLQAETFLNGHVTNPTHPLWRHFETFHVIQTPTYQSKYPPGFACVLAFGWKVGGNPVVGLWLCSALVSAGVCWMLQSWTRPRWALWGGLIAMLHPGILVWWGQTYWGGGALAAFGGALVLGALRRLMQKPSVGTTCLLAFGLLILAMTRPFEGLVLALPVAALLLTWLLQERRWAAPAIFKTVGAPLAFGCVLILGCLAMYDLRVAGSPWRLPYQVHEQQYGSVPLFVWQPEKPLPEYRHRELQVFQTSYSQPFYDHQRTLAGFWEMSRAKLARLWGFFFRLTFTLPIFCLPWGLRNPWIRFAAMTVVLTILALLGETFMVPHYAAPALATIVLLMVHSLRVLRAIRWRQRPIGALLFQAVAVSFFFSAVNVILQHANAKTNDSSQNETYVKALDRQRFIRQLNETAGEHLVMVIYGRDHNPHIDWVFNHPNIDEAKIVWARPLSKAENRQLLEHFHDRRVWIARPDATPATLTPLTDEQRQRIMGDEKSSS